MPEDFFDFEQLSEEEENLDYDHLLECPHCQKPIPQDAIMCYYCGREVYLVKKTKRFRWGFLILIILFLSYFIFFR